MRELRLGEGPIEAIVLPEAGARLHRLRAFGKDLLRTPDDPETHLRDPLFWGAYVMAPWCNRIAAEPTRVADRIVAVESNFPDGSAIHGQVYARPWTLRGDVLTVLGGGDGWPWAYRLSMRITIRNSGLHLALALTNRSKAPMPAGIGLHPWWRRPGLLTVPGAAVYSTNLDPDGYAREPSGLFDLRRPVTPPEGLDATWTELGGKAIVLSWPDLELQAKLRMSTPLDHVAVATPSGLGAITVEPQTHAPGGLARLLRQDRGGLARLAPGATLHATLAIDVRSGPLT